MIPWTVFTKRQHRPELIDQPAIPVTEFERALADIQWVNRHLAGVQTILDEMARMILLYPRQPVYTVLDLGTGSADIPRALCDWGRRCNVPISIVAVDNHPVAVEVAKRLSRGYPEITVCQADALNLDYPDNAFDMVISSMFLHHFDTWEAVYLLHDMVRISRLGVIVNDLERHPLAWLGIALLGRLLKKGRLFCHDAPLSVLNGFKVPELQELTQKAGLTGAQIYRRKPFRLAMVYLRSRMLEGS